jgi:hypothetical protein
MIQIVDERFTEFFIMTIRFVGFDHKKTGKNMPVRENVFEIVICTADF